MKAPLYLVPERKLENFFKFKEGANFGSVEKERPMA